MRKIFFALVFLIFCGHFSFADDPNNRNNPAYDQAKQDYKTYLQQLKALSQQYHQVVGEIKNVMKEEGVPTVDENTGEITMKKFDDISETTPTSADINIAEAEKEITVKMDLPGVRKDTIKVLIQDNKFLKISGERESASRHGRFEKRVELPAAVQDKGTEARYENGVLTVKILKAQEAKKEVMVPVR